MLASLFYRLPPSPSGATLVALALVLGGLTPHVAHGQTTDETDNTPAVRVLRPPPDSLTGHLTLAPKVSYLAPVGNAEQGFSHSKYVRPGPNFGADLAVGISPYVALHGRFDYALLPEATSCASPAKCSANSMAFGIGVQYHVVEGAALDPWVRAGIGYRLTQYEVKLGEETTTRKYSGIDWLHIAMGADWFATQILGFGPYVQLDLGTYRSRPNTPPPPFTDPVSNSVHALLAAGIRIVIAPMR